MTESLPDIDKLAESLLDAAARGNFNTALHEMSRDLERIQPDLDPEAHLRYRVLYFDLSSVSTSDPAIRRETAMGFLAAMLAAGEQSWDAAAGASRMDELHRLATESVADIELFELLAYAPDAGTRGLAVAQLESLAMRMIDAGGDSRPIERLLHGVDASDVAYRVEGQRKQRIAASAATATREAEFNHAPKYRRIAIAGGHRQLRQTATRMLDRRGIRVEQIPSSREAVRRERDVVLVLQGCDAVILLVRQITHSTSDQVRRAAQRLDVPVLYSDALSAVAIERQLFDTSR